MKRRFDLYLKDILESIQRIKTYLNSMEIEEFGNDKKTVDAVLRNLEIIGEAATQLQDDIKLKYPEVLWRDIQDFRIVVAHHYWKINKLRVWDITKNRLDTLKKQIEAILEQEKQ